ncbi:polysaccharide deacetylase family protein [Ferviditalea candida]|uniref:Polysaccharide deacetylase family protein n=1 Tax=Ferviditalea candida TaxID=3108399 RepID=A0ABU5ZL89_9BACL|nr:polysaccharide deacetylase family protein [Paenibacillaceae bacterium T2]
MRATKIAIFAVFFLLIYWMLGQSQPVESFIDLVKLQSVSSHKGGGQYEQVFDRMLTGRDGKSNLLQRIQKKADEFRIAPENAVIDRVWKAIPGYNGLEVDVDKTYKLAMEKKLDDPIPYVFKEIPPAINLEDLEPNPIYKGNPKKPMVAIMINVAWGNEYIPSILKTLRDENVHATFFLDGSWLSKNKSIAEQIMKEGHELSNHAYSHKNMSKLSDAAAENEILKTEKLLKQLNVQNNLFAPPSGDFNQNTVNLANRLHLKTVLWTIDTVDWKNPSPDWIIRRISSRLEPGSLILMHPTRSSSAALPAMIKEIKNRGLVLGTVSELLSTKRVPDIVTPRNF